MCVFIKYAYVFINYAYVGLKLVEVHVHFIATFKSELRYAPTQVRQHGLKSWGKYKRLAAQIHSQQTPDEQRCGHFRIQKWRYIVKTTTVIRVSHKPRSCSVHALQALRLIPLSKSMQMAIKNKNALTRGWLSKSFFGLLQVFTIHNFSLSWCHLWPIYTAWNKQQKTVKLLLK